MDEAELKYLRAFAAKSAGSTIRATVWMDDTGALHAEAVNAAGGGKPRVVTRSTEFTTRSKAEKFIRDVIDTARTH
jgi:hypothetical protein